MQMIEVVKVEPVELPGEMLKKLVTKYQSELKDFSILVDEKNWILYVNKSVPDSEIQGFIDYIYYPGKYIGEDKEDYLTGVFEEYGYSAFATLDNAYKYRIGKEADKRAAELAAVAIPMIEAEIKKENPIVGYDERLLGKVWDAGYKPFTHKTPENIANYGIVYTFYLGYLMGAGLIKESD
ncbi:MAG: hypothetical protein Q4C91_23695 [Eubacteriales bacterium]|nr:hypothetical protein [Eubacteriales bacterium]